MPHDGTGAGWDEAAPADTDQVPLGPQEIRDLRIGTRKRLERELTAPAAGTVGGYARAGMARAYFGGVAPTLKPDGTALDANDNGRLWINGTVVYYYSHPNWVASSGTAVGIAVAVLRHRVAQGVGGGTFTNGAWRTRPINDELDPSGIVTLVANQFTLAAGTYFISAFLPAYRVNAHQGRLQNITDGSTVLWGSGEAANNSSSSASSYSRVMGTFTIASAKAFELQHRCETGGVAGTSGMGFAINFPWGQPDEIHLTAELLKLS